MMREIKFRVWDKRVNKMSPVANISFGDDGSARTIITELAPKDKYYDAVVHGENGVLLQFTGLKDCRGNEIYEGDVLKMGDATAKVVFWGRPPEFGLDFSHNEDEWCEDWDLSDDSERMQIIGNIYEHPELLQEGSYE